MKTLSAIWQNGQVVLDGQADWPDGSRLVVRADPSHGFEFMTEEEQGDTPQAIQQWIDDLRSTPDVAEEPDERTARLAWQQEMRRFNIEAIRKQFEAESP